MDVVSGRCGVSPVLELEKYQIVADDDSTKLVTPLKYSTIHRPVNATTAIKTICMTFGLITAKGTPVDLIKIQRYRVMSLVV